MATVCAMRQRISNKSQFGRGQRTRHSASMCGREIWFPPVRALGIGCRFRIDAVRKRQQTTTGGYPQFYVTYPQVRGILCFKNCGCGHKPSQHRSISSELMPLSRRFEFRSWKIAVANYGRAAFFGAAAFDLRAAGGYVVRHFRPTP